MAVSRCMPKKILQRIPGEFIREHAATQAVSPNRRPGAGTDAVILLKIMGKRRFVGCDGFRRVIFYFSLLK